LLLTAAAPRAAWQAFAFLALVPQLARLQVLKFSACSALEARPRPALWPTTTNENGMHPENGVWFEPITCLVRAKYDLPV
jgi:hypothetical protein